MCCHGTRARRWRASPGRGSSLATGRCPPGASSRAGSDGALCARAAAQAPGCAAGAWCSRLTRRRLCAGARISMSTPMSARICEQPLELNFEYIYSRVRLRYIVPTTSHHLRGQCASAVRTKHAPPASPRSESSGAAGAAGARWVDGSNSTWPSSPRALPPPLPPLPPPPPPPPPVRRPCRVPPALRPRPWSWPVAPWPRPRTAPARGWR